MHHQRSQRGSSVNRRVAHPKRATRTSRPRSTTRSSPRQPISTTRSLISTQSAPCSTFNMKRSSKLSNAFVPSAIVSSTFTFRQKPMFIDMKRFSSNPFDVVDRAAAASTGKKLILSDNESDGSFDASKVYLPLDPQDFLLNKNHPDHPELAELDAVPNKEQILPRANEARSEDQEYEHQFGSEPINLMMTDRFNFVRSQPRSAENFQQLLDLGAQPNSHGEISHDEEMFARRTRMGRQTQDMEYILNPLSPPSLDAEWTGGESFLESSGLNASHVANNFDLDAFENFGELGKVFENHEYAEQISKRFGVNKHGRVKGKVNLPFEFPKLKPGAPIPAGWMVTEDGHCVPQGKEFVHHKYADPELYHGRADDNLLNQVNEKLHPRLKIKTAQEAEAFHEFANTGMHMGTKRHTDRVLHNPIIDQVVANLKNTRYQREVNHDISFEYKNISAFAKKTYNVTMRATSHAYLDIDPAKTKINVKTRPQHSVPGPSMDYSFMSTGWFKANH